MSLTEIIKLRICDVSQLALRSVASGIVWEDFSHGFSKTLNYTTAHSYRLLWWWEVDIVGPEQSFPFHVFWCLWEIHVVGFHIDSLVIGLLLQITESNKLGKQAEETVAVGILLF